MLLEENSNPPQEKIDKKLLKSKDSSLIKKLIEKNNTSCKKNKHGRKPEIPKLNTKICYWN